MLNQIEHPYQNFSIVISCFSRAELLDICLKAVTTAENFDQFNLIVLHQKGHPAVLEILEKYEAEIDFRLVINSQLTTPLENINWNRLTTYRFSFDVLQSEFTLGIEEDVEISKDALTFLIDTHNRYRKSRKYRGANLGSVALNGSSKAYNLMRYGLHGQAGTITRKTWNALPIKIIEGRLRKFPLDAMFEAYLKTGFMVTPVRSKYIDRGWGGTHAPKDPDDSHYKMLQDSFQNESSCSYSVSTLDPLPNWRDDCKVYSAKRNQPYFFIYFLSRIGIKTGKKIYFKIASKLELFLSKKL